MTTRKKIGFLTLDPPEDRRSWSGTYYFMSKAIQENLGDVYYVGPIHNRLEIVGKVANGISTKLLKKKYDYKRSKWFSVTSAKLATRKLKHVELDYIVAPAAASIVASLPDIGVPIVFVSDTTFALINEYYKNYSNYLSLSIKEGNQLAKDAMERSALLLFPTEWAAKSAINDYGMKKEKVHVLPFGANMESIPDRDIAFTRHRSGQCKMLFLGVDWDRKGGDIAYDALLHLESDFGIKAQLKVVGCTPPKNRAHERIEVVGFLNKNDPVQAAKLSKLFVDCDYLFLPTRNECFGVVFCEASSYGMPSISTDTGGVSGVISNGKNGYILPMDATGEDYAKVIAEIERSDSAYDELCKSSRIEYETRLNWDEWAKALGELVGKSFQQ